MNNEMTATLDNRVLDDRVDSARHLNGRLYEVSERLRHALERVRGPVPESSEGGPVDPEGPLGTIYVLGNRLNDAHDLVAGIEQQLADLERYI